MADITIISNVADACSVVFNEPAIALAWLRAVIGDIPADTFLGLAKTLHPEQADAAADMVRTCLGTGV